MLLEGGSESVSVPSWESTGWRVPYLCTEMAERQGVGMGRHRRNAKAQDFPFACLPIFHMVSMAT